MLGRESGADFAAAASGRFVRTADLDMLARPVVNCEGIARLQVDSPLALTNDRFCDYQVVHVDHLSVRLLAPLDPRQLHAQVVSMSEAVERYVPLVSLMCSAAVVLGLADLSGQRHESYDPAAHVVVREISPEEQMQEAFDRESLLAASDSPASMRSFRTL